MTLASTSTSTSTSTSSSSPSSSGPSTLYCLTCGDCLSSSIGRCKRCYSRGHVPLSSSISRSSKKSHADPWASRYLSGMGNLPGSPVVEKEDEMAMTMAIAMEQQQEQPRGDEWGRRSLNRTSATAYSLGIGTPSSISRDLRPSPKSTPTKTPGKAAAGSASTSPRRPLISLNLVNRDQGDESQDSLGPLPPLSPGLAHLAHMPNSASQPLLELPAGRGLSKVVGSMVEPSANRSKWACADCAGLFKKDSTIYAPPASAVTSDPSISSLFFCKDCYTHRYALGICARESCAKPVLGSTKETGTYVKAGAGVIYHGTCFRCHNCDAGGGRPSAGDGTEIVLDMAGRPSCGDCFGAAPRRREVPARLLQSQRQSQSPTKSADGQVPSQSLSSPTRTTAAFAATAFSPSLAGTEKGFDFSPSSQTRQMMSRPTTSPTKMKMKMGATIAELSSRLGAPIATPAAARETEAARVQRSASPTRLESAVASDSTGLSMRERRAELESRVELNTSPVRPGGSAAPVAPASPTRQSETKKTPMGRFPLPRNRETAAATAAASSPTASSFPPSLATAPLVKAVTESSSSAAYDADLCSICELPLLPSSTPGEVKILTLPSSGAAPISSPKTTTTATTECTSIQVHATCFRCSICSDVIDSTTAGRNSFVRLDGHPPESMRVEGKAAGAFAHPHCAPPVKVSPLIVAAAATAREFMPSPSMARNNVTSSPREPVHPTIRSTPRATLELQRQGGSASDRSDPSAASSPISPRKARPAPLTGLARPLPTPTRNPASVAASSYAFLPSSSPTRAVPSTSRLGSSLPPPSPSPSSLSSPFSANQTTTSGSQWRSSSPTRPYPSGAANANPAAGMFSTGRTYAKPASVDASLSDTPSAGLSSPGGALNPATAANGRSASPTRVPARYGGMQQCVACSLPLTMLESVPGPAGTSWHRACLVCQAPSVSLVGSRAGGGATGAKGKGICGKQLDSSAKVRGEDGGVRCAGCFREGR